jgi:hypothetical protein
VIWITLIVFFFLHLSGNYISLNRFLWNSSVSFATKAYTGGRGSAEANPAIVSFSLAQLFTQPSHDMRLAD